MPRVTLRFTDDRFRQSFISYTKCEDYDVAIRVLANAIRKSPSLITEPSGSHVAYDFSDVSIDYDGITANSSFTANSNHPHLLFGRMVNAYITTVAPTRGFLVFPKQTIITSSTELHMLYDSDVINSQMKYYKRTLNQICASDPTIGRNFSKAVVDRHGESIGFADRQLLFVVCNSVNKLIDPRDASNTSILVACPKVKLNVIDHTGLSDRAKFRIACVKRKLRQLTIPRDKFEIGQRSKLSEGFSALVISALGQLSINDLTELSSLAYGGLLGDYLLKYMGRINNGRELAKFVKVNSTSYLADVARLMGLEFRFTEADVDRALTSVYPSFALSSSNSRGVLAYYDLNDSAVICNRTSCLPAALVDRLRPEYVNVIKQHSEILKDGDENDWLIVILIVAAIYGTALLSTAQFPTRLQLALSESSLKAYVNVKDFYENLRSVGASRGNAASNMFRRFCGYYSELAFEIFKRLQLDLPMWKNEMINLPNYMRFDYIKFLDSKGLTEFELENLILIRAYIDDATGAKTNISAYYRDSIGIRNPYLQ